MHQSGIVSQVQIKHNESYSETSTLPLFLYLLLGWPTAIYQNKTKLQYVVHLSWTNLTIFKNNSVYTECSLKNLSLCKRPRRSAGVLLKGLQQAHKGRLVQMNATLTQTHALRMHVASVSALQRH